MINIFNRVAFKSFLRTQQTANYIKHISNWQKVEVGLAREQHPANSNLPLKNSFGDVGLDRQEIESRILKVLSHFEKVDLKAVNFQGFDITQDLKLDSLERIAFLTSVEEEFTTLFEDRVFDNIKSLEQLVTQLEKNTMIF